uniref:Putative ovule protein n=1 Tax=Solanum chacoense TaxID=4108 RepID=A0A0V0IHL3_SOLCH
MKVKESVVEVTLPLPQITRPLHLFPQRLKRRAEDGKFPKFIAMLRQLSMNIPLAKALEQISCYAKFMKDLVTKKIAASLKPTDKVQYCSVIATKSLV